MSDNKDRKPVVIQGMCSKDPQSYRIGETPKENFLTLREVRNVVKNGKAPYCVHSGTKREILTVRETLHKAKIYAEKEDDSTHIEYVHEAPEGTVQNNDNLWDRYIDDETGKVLVDEGIPEESVWGIGYFLLPREDGTFTPMSPDDVSDILEEILEERSTARDFSNQEALAMSIDMVRAVIVLSHSEAPEVAIEETTDDPEWEIRYHAMARGEEVLDRLYNYNRILLAGVDMDQHPEYHHYQAFYDMGMKPPSHQEMADHIIRTLV